METRDAMRAWTRKRIITHAQLPRSQLPRSLLPIPNYHLPTIAVQ
jgi:hypothetical protein